MIQLRSDYLVFKTRSGEIIPCSAEALTFELIHKTANMFDPETVRNAAGAVAHYFRHELKQTCVSVREFAEALAKVLQTFGISGSTAPVATPSEEKPALAVAEWDLLLVARASGDAYELTFFPKLREIIEERMDGGAEVLRFSRLRPCVKHLSGRQRWTRGCQRLNDQIVGFLRRCWASNPRSKECALVIR